MTVITACGGEVGNTTATLPPSGVTNATQALIIPDQCAQPSSLLAVRGQNFTLAASSDNCNFIYLTRGSVTFNEQRNSTISTLMDAFERIELQLNISNQQILVSEDLTESDLHTHSDETKNIIMTVGSQSPTKQEIIFDLAREVHKIKRAEEISLDATLLDYLTSEGMAQHYAAGVSGLIERSERTILANNTSDFRPRLLKSLAQSDYQLWSEGDGEISVNAKFSYGYDMVSRYFQQQPGANSANAYMQQSEWFRQYINNLDVKANKNDIKPLQFVRILQIKKE